MSADSKCVEDGGQSLDVKKGLIYDAILLDEADDLAALSQKSLPISQFRTRKDQTALHLAISNSSFRVLDFLGTLSLPASFVNERNDCGETALHLVAATGDESLLRRFLALFGDKVDPDAKDKWDRTPSLLAVQNGYTSLVELGLLPKLSPTEHARLDEEAHRLKEQSEHLSEISTLKAAVQSDFLSQLRSKQATRRKSGQLTGDGDTGIPSSAHLNGSEKHEHAATVSVPSIMVKHIFARDVTHETTSGERLGVRDGEPSPSAMAAGHFQSHVSAGQPKECSAKLAVASQSAMSHESQQVNNGGPEASSSPRRSAACNVTSTATIVTTSVLSIGPSVPSSRPASAAVPLSKLMEYPGNLALLQSVRLHPTAAGVSASESGPVYDVNGRDFYGMTALHKACSWNKADIVAFLLQLPAIDANQRVPAVVKGTASLTAQLPSYG